MEVLSCQPKFLVKPLVDKPSGQIGSSLPARPRPPPLTGVALIAAGAGRPRPRQRAN